MEVFFANKDKIKYQKISAMKEWFKNFFYYTPTERNGVIGLCALLFLITIFPYFIPFFYTKSTTDFTAYRNEIAAFEASLQIADAEEDNKYTHKNNNYSDNATPAESFAFDPNTASETDLVRLGLSPKTAATIANYRSKGGKFKTPDDFGKIYSIRPVDLARLKPLIQIVTNISRLLI